ncbi:MAG: tetratricopeptide repeat protein [Bacteroidota bacterium]
MKRLILLLICYIGLAPLQAQLLSPDDTEGALRLLLERREAISKAEGPHSASLIAEMLKLGMWEEIEAEVKKRNLPEDVLLEKAHFLILKNRYEEAEQILRKIKPGPASREAIQLLNIRLQTEAWELKKAEQSCINILKNSPRSEATVLQLGSIYVLQKNFDKALALAKQVQEWNPENSGAYLLAAEALLWKREQAPAEEALRKCLELDPFNPDARFYYGYAIWRRVDATQLPDMAAQWKLALEIHPLHYLTHWHWGNGHTQLTYADYAQKEDKEVRKALKKANSALGDDNSKLALKLANGVGRDFPESVLPDMFKASAYYQLQNSDSAESIFLRILRRKKNYGPAHNGLAAVIKQRRFPYLQYSDSLEKEIKQSRIENEAQFYKIFPDLAFYPGDRVSQMVYQQLYTGVVYLPFLEKLNRKFVIPPLHVDLAEAMGNSFFRGGTTFDNRQWMDIRGVGSGATGIEYVERGAHLERNVTLHEYVHLFHGSIFSDTEMREVRKRYYYAMENDCTLDYYGANNEFEYLAQAFPAYFIPIKVHPLNHKSMNTRGDLQSKDPLMFEFVDRLVKKHKAYLNGDKNAMASNWAHVYIQLSQRASIMGLNSLEIQHLETALSWDSTYVPTYLAYAQAFERKQDFDSARIYLDKAIELSPDFAPAQQAYARWEMSRFQKGITEQLQTVKSQKAYYKRAEELETDIGLRPRLNREIRQFYLSFGLIAEAIETAESYVSDAPTVSTYLRDSKDVTEAFMYEQKGILGYQEKSLEFFKNLIAQKPQNYQHRIQYARVLLANQQLEKAKEILEEGNRILSASGNSRSDYLIELANIHFKEGDSLAAKKILTPVLEKKIRNRSNPYQWIQTLVDIGELELAEKSFRRQDLPRIPYEKSQYLLTAAKLEIGRGNTELAQLTLQEAVKSNIYNFKARFLLLELLDSEKDYYQIRKLANQGILLPVPPAGALKERLLTYLHEE